MALQRTIDEQRHHITLLEHILESHGLTIPTQIGVTESTFVMPTSEEVEIESSALISSLSQLTVCSHDSLGLYERKPCDVLKLLAGER